MTDYDTQNTASEQILGLLAPQLTAIIDNIVGRLEERFLEMMQSAANDNHRTFDDGGRNGALGREPVTERDEVLARIKPEQVASSIGWEKFDEYDGRIELSTRDAAMFLGVSDWTLRSWRRTGNEGKGPRYTQLATGGPVTYSLQDLAEFHESKLK